MAKAIHDAAAGASLGRRPRLTVAGAMMHAARTKPFGVLPQPKTITKGLKGQRYPEARRFPPPYMEGFEYGIINLGSLLAAQHATCSSHNQASLCKETARCQTYERKRKRQCSFQGQEGNESQPRDRRCEILGLGMPKLLCGHSLTCHARQALKSRNETAVLPAKTMRLTPLQGALLLWKGLPTLWAFGRSVRVIQGFT